MRKLALFAAALLVSLAAQAAPPGVSVRLRGAPRRALQAAPAAPTCAAPALAPVGWIDPADGLAVATHPTARLDAQELHSLTLASLLQLRLGPGGATLFVLGAPARPGERLARPDPTAGWRPRWPFC